MHWLLYMITLIFPAITIGSLFLGGVWTWSLLIISFGLIPVAELFLSPSGYNREAAEEERVREAWVYRLLPVVLVPLQWVILAVFLALVSNGSLSTPLELMGAIASVAVCCGTFGINMGHELGHRQTRWEQNLAKVALISTLYVHFFIEHNRGHHRRVATPEDPATARRGELVYAFWLRSIVGGWRSAWTIAPREMLQLQLVQLAVWVGLAIAFGPVAVGVVALSALGGALILETVNYIEHYGLVRRKRDNGKYERVQPMHSWNSDHPIGRALLFELSRHSDHHAHPGRPFALLRSFPGAPQFPTGYPGMVLLSLVPPLFFRTMNPLLERWDVELA